MDFYTLFKFLHVVTAIAWVGGGMTLLVSSIVTMRSQGDEAVLKSLDTMNGLGKVWFTPASLLTVVFGAIATTFGGPTSVVFRLDGRETIVSAPELARPSTLGVSVGLSSRGPTSEARVHYDNVRVTTP